MIINKDDFKGVRPINYREIQLIFDGQTVTVAGMAKPNYRGHISQESMTYLTQETPEKPYHFSTLVGLHPEKEYSDVAKAYGVNYKPMKIKDFTAPERNVFENTYQIIRQATHQKTLVAIHCGEGFGRTGTVLAALKLREMIYTLPIETLCQQPKSAEFELGAHDKFKKLHCTQMVKEAIVKIRRGDENDDSVENELQIKSLERYQCFLITQRRQESLKKISAFPISNDTRMLLEAQSTLFLLQDLQAKEIKTEVDIHDKQSYLIPLSKLSARIESASATLIQLQTIKARSSIEEADCHRQLINQFEDFIQTAIAHANQTIQPVIDEYCVEPELLNPMSSFVEICALESKLELLANPPNDLLSLLLNLSQQLAEYKSPVTDSFHTIHHADIKATIESCLLCYELFPVEDRLALPKDIQQELETLSIVLTNPDSIEDSSQSLVNVRLAALNKAIEINHDLLQTYQPAPYLIDPIKQKLQTQLCLKANNFLNEKNYIGDKVQTNILLSRLLNREQLIGTFSAQDISAMINEPVFLESAFDIKLIIHQIPLEDLQNYLSTNQWLVSSIYSTVDKTAELLNQLEPNRQAIVIGAIIHTLSDKALNEEYINLLENLLQRSDVKTLFMTAVRQHRQTLQAPMSHAMPETYKVNNNTTASFANSSFGFFKSSHHSTKYKSEKDDEKENLKIQAKEHIIQTGSK